MKKVLSGLLAVLLLSAAIGIGFFVTLKIRTAKNNTVAQTPAAANKSFSVLSACDLLTEADAGTAIGAAAKKGDDQESASATTDEIQVTNCSYTNASSQKLVSLLVRSAKTQGGADSNLAAFGTNKPVGTTAATGLGEAAFWNPAYGQLNVLKNHSWFIFSSGGYAVTARSQADTTRLATTVLARVQ